MNEDAIDPHSGDATGLERTHPQNAVSEPSRAEAGDIVQLVGISHKHHIVKLQHGGQLQTHRGVIDHDDLIGRPWGSRITSHIGRPFFLLEPSLADLLKNLRRRTQILYPKDIGYILMTMGIAPGRIVIEGGTGSGAMTAALASAVGKIGQVITYDNHAESQALARKNLRWLGLEDRVVLKLRDIVEGFDERGVDALFMDVPNPQDYLRQVLAALKTGGFFGCILPTTNQVSLLLRELKRFPFAFVDVCETQLRHYRPDPERLRPVDRMVAHTGFLIFGRSIDEP